MTRWDQNLTGVHTHLIDPRTDMSVPYVCARCWEPVWKLRLYEEHMSPWVHAGSRSNWCVKTKQYGAKARYVLPVPGLLVIPEWL